MTRKTMMIKVSDCCEDENRKCCINEETSSEFVAQVEEQLVFKTVMNHVNLLVRENPKVCIGNNGKLLKCVLKLTLPAELEEDSTLSKDQIDRSVKREKFVLIG